MIYALKGDSAIQGHLRRHWYDPLKICVITLMELYYGAYRSRHVTSNLAKLKSLENWVEILPIGKESVEIFGIQKAQLQKTGTPLDDFDLIVSSCALANNLVLVTNNVKHFKRIEGLQLENWSKQP